MPISLEPEKNQEAVNSLLSSFACTIISENKNFHFISTLNILRKLTNFVKLLNCVSLKSSKNGLSRQLEN